jgi:CRP-like cAMP-binding protein
LRITGRSTQAPVAGRAARFRLQRAERTMSIPPLEILIRKLQTNSLLSEHDRRALRELELAPKPVRADLDIVRQGDRPSHCAILLSGWAYRYKVLSSGKRQIVSFHLPGDMPDLQSLLIPTSDHHIATLSDSVVALVPHSKMRDLMARAPGIAEVFWRDTLIDAAIYREWVVNVGQRPALERVAHLFCETFVRLEALGLVQRADGKRMFPWPLTQTLLGEAAGMSSVHANRVLQELRGSGLIATLRGMVTIPNWDLLQDLAGFEPDYLSVQEIQSNLQEDQWPLRSRFALSAAIVHGN